MGVQCYELFGGIALKNHAFSFFIDARFFILERILLSVLLTVVSCMMYARFA